MRMSLPRLGLFAALAVSSLFPAVAWADSNSACVAPATLVSVGAPPVVGIWHKGDAGPAWSGPDCAAWTSGKFSAVVSLSGSFAFAGSGDDLLVRFGAISSLAGIRYWSVSDSDWRTLVTKAQALGGAESQQRRADFTLAEMRHDGDFYYSQNDSRSSSAVTYRMRVVENSPNRVVIEVENVSSVKLLLLPIYGAGDIKSTVYLSRGANGIWSYYALSAVHEGSLSFGSNHDASYVNRAVAFYRHVAGIPTDLDPPLAR